MRPASGLAEVSLAGLSPGVVVGEPAWLTSLRGEALESVARRGFPTLKDEDWRYTRLAPLLEVPFRSAGEEEGRWRPNASLDELVGDLGGSRLVFVNGHLALDLSRVGDLPVGLRLQSLASALLERGEELRPYFERLAADHHAFSALNAALAEDGAFIELAPGTVAQEPIHLVFIAGGGSGPRVVSPRSLVLAGEGSAATVIETYLGTEDERYLHNALTEVVLGEGARLEHYKIQIESEHSFHLATLDVRQEAASQFSTRSLALGASIARHEVQVSLEGEGARAEVHGLFMPRGEQHHDNPTLIEHAAPNCTSHEVYKGVVDGHGHGVFNGRVIVHVGAAGTDASQLNRNLLLTESAEVDTRPRLEILADDVKVSHGAAVGQLDEEALFYLRSRGIPLEQARRLLIAAFVEEALDLFALAPLRERARQLLDERLTNASVPS